MALPDQSTTTLPSPEDFPQMWQKPAFDDLISCLRSLRVEPPVWNSRTSQSEILKKQQQRQHEGIHARKQIATYLGSVIKSSLSWVEDDDQKEEVWTEASRRLSERCGRTAMGEITRRWSFQSDDNDYPPFELVIREPPLTGDDLGLKTWGSSYLLAQMLHEFARGPFRHLLSTTEPGVPAAVPPVLELGSGTGLLGLAAAAVWQVPVSLSDLPAIVPNLAHNVEQNRAVVEELGGRVAAGALTWGGAGEDEVDPVLFEGKNRFKIVLAADPLYDDNHPALLASAIDEQLALDPGSRALVMVPQRDATTTRLLAIFREAMAVSGASSTPFLCAEEGSVSGQDDWGDDGAEEAEEDVEDEDGMEDRPQNVKCWWGTFQRQQPKTHVSS